MKFATFAFSAVAAVASVSTFAVVCVGAKKMQQEIDELRSKTNKTLNKMKSALVEMGDL